MPPATTAPSSSRSAQFGPSNPPPRVAVNRTVTAAPATATTQNALGGRSPPRRTASTAVAAGSSAITTAPWLAGTEVSAKDVSTGKPTTTPPATTARRNHWRPRGSRCRVRPNAAAASTAATTALPLPTNSGDIPAPSTAIRVSGTVKENAVTPNRPQPRPAHDGDSGARGAGVALL